MDLFSLVFTGIGLAMDCFAVSLGIGAGNAARSVRPIFRLSFHFGLFQGLMTILGWLVGTTVAQFIANIDHWIVLLLLGWVGTRMIIEGFKPANDDHRRTDPSRGGMLVMLAVATSLDAMAVGLSMAIIKVNIVAASALIGVITLVLSLAGLLIGNRLGTTFGKRMEIIGGLVLNGIGLRILITHLFNMRVGLLSDTHNSISNLRTAIERLRKEKIETIFHLGDLTSLEISQQLVEFHVICTFGNGDWDANEIHKNLMFYRADNFGGMVFRGEIDGIKIAATHGHLPDMVDNLVGSGEFAYVFHGHTHRRRDERIRISRVINPGALGGLHVEPRSFAILDLETDSLKVEIIL